MVTPRALGATLGRTTVRWGGRSPLSLSARKKYVAAQADANATPSERSAMISFFHALSMLDWSQPDGHDSFRRSSSDLPVVPKYAKVPTAATVSPVAVHASTLGPFELGRGAAGLTGSGRTGDVASGTRLNWIATRRFFCPASTRTVSVTGKAPGCENSMTCSP